MLIISNTEALCADFNSTRAAYRESAERLRREIDQTKRQQLLADTLRYARILLGIVDGLNFSALPIVKPFCELLQSEAKKIGEPGNVTDTKIALRMKRDIIRLNESAKFLTACASLLDALYNDGELISIIVNRIPEDVPHIAMEITTMLYVIEMITKEPTNIERPVNRLLEFATSAEDGTRLLSRLMTCLMASESRMVIKEKLLSSDFPAAHERKYLSMR
ncbi:MAG: hypothetical protein LBJ42_01105 [Holosporales bacterium]|nr:hypothetical protein [Holosporales bacterium]